MEAVLKPIHTGEDLLQKSIYQRSNKLRDRPMISHRLALSCSQARQRLCWNPTNQSSQLPPAKGRHDSCHDASRVVKGRFERFRNIFPGRIPARPIKLDALLPHDLRLMISRRILSERCALEEHKPNITKPDGKRRMQLVVEFLSRCTDQSASDWLT